MSSSSTTIFGTAEKIFRPLIRENIFKNYNELLKHLMLTYINQQLKTYQKKVHEFETKHQLSFEDFTRSLKGKASWQDEDKWLDWEDAVVFLKKWQKIKDEVFHAPVE
jgi:hypothetical protein